MTVFDELREHKYTRLRRLFQAGSAVSLTRPGWAHWVRGVIVHMTGHMITLNSGGTCTHVQYDDQLEISVESRGGDG